MEHAKIRPSIPPQYGVHAYLFMNCAIFMSMYIMHNCNLVRLNRSVFFKNKNKNIKLPYLHFSCEKLVPDLPFESPVGMLSALETIEEFSHPS